MIDKPTNHPDHLTNEDLLHLHLSLTRLYRKLMAEGHIFEANEVANRLARVHGRIQGIGVKAPPLIHPLS
jgi:hypothetical protein